jgi:hypothetical protein
MSYYLEAKVGHELDKRLDKVGNAAKVALDWSVNLGHNGNEAGRRRIARSGPSQVCNVPADLGIHLVMDNYGTQKTKLIRNWFAKRPCWHVHFTPTSASWINLVESFFALLTNRAVRRGSFQTVAEL